MGRRILRNRVGGIHPDIRVEWVVATLVKEIQLGFKVVSLNRTGFEIGGAMVLKCTSPLVRRTKKN